MQVKEGYGGQLSRNVASMYAEVKEGAQAGNCTTEAESGNCRNVAVTSRPRMLLKYAGQRCSGSVAFLSRPGDSGFEMLSY